MKNLIVSALAVAAILGSGAYIYKRSAGKSLTVDRPNILVISSCSLRHDAVEHMPRVKEFFGKGSFQFPHAFNGLGWTALFAVTAPEIRNSWFKKVNYQPAGMWIKNHMFLIPARNSWKMGFTREEKRRGVTPPDSNFEKDYRASLDFFINSLAGGTMLPYFVVAQLKYAHFPLIDRFNADSKWDQFLSESEKKRVQDYTSSPEKFPNKLPFLLMLTNDTKVLRGHPLVNKAIQERSEKEGAGHDNAFLGLLNTPGFLKDWEASADYRIDLEILKKIYKANVIYMDKIVGEILDRLKADGELSKTVVIFAGDHGEVHMERGHLTHGTSWFDPALRVPLMIRFPNQDGGEVLSEQTNFFTVTKIIKGIAEGAITVHNFAEKFREINDPVVIGRDCSNTWRAIRHKNKWKYVVDNSSGESFLYDLEKDSGETRNVAAENPTIIAELESLFWQKLPRLANQMVNTCDPWPGPKPVRED